MLSVLTLLPCGCIGATLYGESPRQTMRRERPASSIQLNSHGDMAKSGPQAPRTNLKSNYCNFDFPSGVEKTNNCANNGTLMDAAGGGPNLCLAAAASSHAASTNLTAFEEYGTWQNDFPKGCFKYKCDLSQPMGSDGTNVCFHYNPTVGTPDPATMTGGVPICQRPKYVNGVQGTDGGCPAGYVVLALDTATDDASVETMSQKCREAAPCMGTASDVFSIGAADATQKLLFPRGCFIRDDDSKVDYNGASGMDSGRSTSLTGLKGTPLCVVETENPEASAASL